MERYAKVVTWSAATLALLVLTGSLPAQEKLPRPVPAEAAGKAAPPAGPGPIASSCGFDWAKVPPVHVFPRLGFFGILPTGPGYYSLLDYLRHECSPDRPKYGYLPFALQPFPFFDADFRYLEKTAPQDCLEALHRVHIGDNFLLASGGEFRWRHMHEINSRLSGKPNDYELLRTRVFADVCYQDSIRAYVEFLDAHTFNENLAPNLVDVDRSDFLDAFLELKIWDGDMVNADVRGGRPELLYGSQRLVSPLDWGNTRRTFDGVRGYYTSEKWDVDLFWAQPVIPTPSRLDSVDNNQNFAGAWATYRPDKGQFRDFYYLFLDNTQKISLLGINRAPVNVHTLGTRWAGDKNHWLYDVEGMLQLGRQGQQDVLAGAVSTGLGYHFANAPMSPVVWAYYDYASGDHNVNHGRFTTFNQLYPFGHYYLGWLDLVGRQNIHDINAHLYLYPTKWLTVNMQYHHFELASSRDALYNAAGVAIRRDPTGTAGSNVGDELDLIINFHLSRHSDFLVGYSFMEAGNFLKQTGSRSNPELFYAMYNFRW